MREINLTTPLSEEDVKKLKIGDIVKITGTIYAFRDLAHQRLLSGEQLPFDFNGSVIYHCSPLMKGKKILSAGPTSSIRLDKFTPGLLKKYRIRALVGKGGMGKDTQKALQEHCCVYLSYPGGCGVLASRQIKNVKSYWKDLGPVEMVRVFQVENFGPVSVTMDSHGGNLYEEVMNNALKNLAIEERKRCLSK
jgi:fumarate hydratase subunit beta